MRWNDGYKIFEKLIINLYNNDRLDKKILEIIATDFIGFNTDFAGFTDLKAKDNKNLVDIICFMYEPAKYFECINNDNYVNEELMNLYFEITDAKWKV